MPLYLYYFVAMICLLPDYVPSSEVKPRNRILFPRLVLIFLGNVHLGCDLAECCLCPSWFFLVIPSVICLFCHHIHDNTHTFIHTSCIVKFSKSLLIRIH